jgi:hypothetical protein
MDATDANSKPESQQSLERGQGIRFDCTECGDEVGPFGYYWRLANMRRICEDCAHLLGVGPHNRTEQSQ